MSPPLLTPGLPAMLRDIDSDPKYGAIGAPFRSHGRCTCKNNGAWPACSVCMDMSRCHGCEHCSPERTRLTGWHTLGPEWVQYHRFLDTARAHEAYVEAQRVAPEAMPPGMTRDEFLAMMVEQHLGSARMQDKCVKCGWFDSSHPAGKYPCKQCPCDGYVSAWRNPA